MCCEPLSTSFQTDPTALAAGSFCKSIAGVLGAVWICVLCVFVCLPGLRLFATTPADDRVAAFLPPYLPLESAREQATLRDVDFRGSVGIGVGDLGRIVRSDDDGKTWQAVESPIAAMLVAVRWIDANRIVAVGNILEPITGARRGVVVASVDGGRRFSIPTDEELPGIDQLHVENGTVVCSGDWSYPNETNCHESRDAGQTWFPATPIATVIGTSSDSLPIEIGNRDRSPSLTIVANDVADIPWADVAIAAIQWRYATRVILVSPNHRGQNVLRVGALRQVVAMMAGRDAWIVDSVADANRLIASAGFNAEADMLWIGEQLESQQQAFTAARQNKVVYHALDAENRETLVPRLGVLRSDFSEDAFRYLAPMQPVVRRHTTPTGQSLERTLESVGKQPAETEISRYQLQIAGARLPRRQRLAEYLQSLSKPADRELDSSKGVLELLSRTDAWDQQRLAWMMIRMARRMDFEHRMQDSAPGQWQPVAPQIIASVASFMPAREIGRWAAMQSEAIWDSSEQSLLNSRRFVASHRGGASLGRVSLSPFESRFDGSSLNESSIAQVSYASPLSATAAITIPDAVATSQMDTPALPDAANVPLRLLWEFSPARLMFQQSHTHAPTSSRLDPLRRCTIFDWSSMCPDDRRQLGWTDHRPRLDGDLDEWPAATVVRHRDGDQTSLRLMRDQEYLYVAAELPIDFQARSEANLGRDGLSSGMPVWQLSIDLDGDLCYPIYFNVAADHSHAERIGDDHSFHPSWYFKQRPSATGGIIEAAIAWRNLSPLEPKTTERETTERATTEPETTKRANHPADQNQIWIRSEWHPDRDSLLEVGSPQPGQWISVGVNHDNATQ